MLIIFQKLFKLTIDALILKSFVKYYIVCLGGYLKESLKSFMLTEADVSTLLQVAEFSAGHPAALYR